MCAVRIFVGKTQAAGTIFDPASPRPPTQYEETWRFNASADVKRDVPTVSYQFPARGTTDPKSALKAQRPSKKKPWGVDCYSLGRLLYQMYEQGDEDEEKGMSAHLVSCTEHV